VQVPSGPGLACDLMQFPAYRAALIEADYVIPDSGFMVMVWNAMHLFFPGKVIHRYSGLRLLQDLVGCPQVREAGASFWVMPTREDHVRNLAWLRANGFAGMGDDDCYVAPYYRGKLGREGAVEDAVLLQKIRDRRPKFVFLNVGSGVQEQLGHYLARNLDSRPAILCTGAAIAFLTGGQASIPSWADRFFLGWLLRTLNNPLRFGARYSKAMRLLPILLKYRDRLPPGDR